MRKYSANGFSLIELMIAVVVFAVLSAIAYPNYTDYIIQARRSDATINLTRVASLQEKFHTNCGRYADNSVLLGASITCGGIPRTLNAGLSPSGVTANGYYTLSVVVAAGPPPPAGGPGLAGMGDFTLTAVPTVGSQQALKDGTKCGTFTINGAGLKTATGTDGNLTNGGKCWKK